MKSRTDNISSEAKTSKGIAYDSRWMIISVIALTLFLFCLEGRAQLVSSNPMEYVALAEGNELINSQIKNQIEDQQKTALLQNTIAAEFTQIRQWERKYNSYLKTVSGYASTLKACSHLYDDGVRIFISELITVYSILKDAVAKGGASNMLTGAERSKILWELNDRLAQFNKRLSQLSISIRYYTMADVWNRATAGMIDRNTAEIAGQALDRWHRCARIVTP